MGLEGESPLLTGGAAKDKLIRSQLWALGRSLPKGAKAAHCQTTEVGRCVCVLKISSVVGPSTQNLMKSTAVVAKQYFSNLYETCYNEANSYMMKGLCIIHEHEMKLLWLLCLLLTSLWQALDWNKVDVRVGCPLALVSWHSASSTGARVKFL